MIVGPFLQIAPVVADLEAADSLAGLARQIGETWQEALDPLNAPGPAVLNAACIWRVLVSFAGGQGGRPGGPAAGAVSFRPSEIVVPRAYVKQQLHLAFTQGPEAISLTLFHASGRIGADKAARFVADIRAILEAAVADPGARL